MQIWEAIRGNLTILLYVIWAAMAVVGGIVVVALRRPKEGPLLPPQRWRAVPWNGLDLLFLVFLIPLLVPIMVFLFLDGGGLYREVYGVAAHDAKGPLLQRMWLWAGAAAFPLQIALCFSLLRNRGQVEPYQIGFTTHRWRANVIFGFLAWVVVTPLVFAVADGVEWLHELWLPPERHMFVEVAIQKPPPSLAEWGLIFFLAVIAAPVMEEFLFRGLLQRWFRDQPWGADVAIAASFIYAFLTRGTYLETAFSNLGAAERFRALIQGILPGLFVLAMIPGYIYSDLLAWRWLPQLNAGRAIYATSLLFAIFHGSVWPSPVPLFPLALALGFVAHRTQSLVPSITMHGLFNLVSCFGMLLATPEAYKTNGSEETSTPAAVSSSSLVPDVSLPRRT